MVTKGVSHIAIGVRDMDKSLRFYRDLLGFQVVRDEIQKTRGTVLPALYRDPHEERRAVIDALPLISRALIIATPRGHRILNSGSTVVLACGVNMPTSPRDAYSSDMFNPAPSRTSTTRAAD